MSKTRNTISGFHAHVYFEIIQAEVATKLCKDAAAKFGVNMGNVYHRPIGPHPKPSCQLGCTKEQLGVLLPWLMEMRGDLSVFCHAHTGNHLEDHTKHAFWLGTPTSLNLEIFN